MNVSKAVDSAWKRMVYLLWEKGSLRRWMALGFLAGMASGSAGFNAPGNFFPSKPDGPHLDGSVLAIIAVVALLALGFGLVISYLCCVARFVFVENLIYDRHAILEPAWRLARLGLRLFGFYFLTGVGLVIAIVGVVLCMGVGFGVLSQANEGAALLGLVLGILGVMLPVIIVFGLFMMVCDDLVVPVMYKDDCGPIAAWGRLFGIFRRNKVAFFWWAAVRIVLAMGWGTVAFMVAAACFLLTLAAVAVVALPVGMVAHVDLESGSGVALMILSGLALLVLLIPQMLVLSSPGIVLMKSFSIYCLQQLDLEVEMLPEGGRLTINDVIREEVADPGFSPSPALPADGESEWSGAV